MVVQGQNSKLGIGRVLSSTARVPIIIGLNGVSYSLFLWEYLLWVSCVLGTVPVLPGYNTEHGPVLAPGCPGPHGEDRQKQVNRK